MTETKVRLYVDHPLAAGQPVELTRDQAHYLFAVMRLAAGDVLRVFNGVAGEWRAAVQVAGKRGGVLAPLAQTRPQAMPPDLWLLFAPIKKARTDFIVEKAAELGVRRIVPVQTAFTNSDRIRQDRLQAHAIEAAEQCGGTFVPEVTALHPLAKALDLLEGRRLVFCDEALSDDPAWSGPGQAGALPPPPAAVLIGPEGGFSVAERTALRALPGAVPFGLGPRILRADTAAVAALTLWQAAEGDWQ